MTPREANVLLTQAALLDGRLRREPEERAQMAVAWAEVLADVTIEVGMSALAVHYREQSRTVMPADIVAIAEESGTSGRVAVEDASEWLEARGVDPREFQKRLDAGERPARALRELGGAL